MERRRCDYPLLRKYYFRFGGRHLAFPMSVNVGDKSLELVDLENMGFAVGTAGLSMIEVEI